MKRFMIMFVIFIGSFPLNVFSACHSEFLCDNYGNCKWVEVCDSPLDIPAPKVYTPRISPVVPPEPPSIEPIGPPGSSDGQHLYNPDKGEWDWYFD
jgi:hypothetical protein